MKTFDEIKVAQKKCADGKCAGCPYRQNKQNCQEEMLRDTLARIQQPEGVLADGPMTLNQYQSLARRTQRDDMTINMRRDHALHLLAAEVGEIHSIYQKAYQGHVIDKTRVLDEAGDVLWGLAELMDALGYTMEDMARHNIDKLKARYPGGFDPERSLYREEKTK